MYHFSNLMSFSVPSETVGVADESTIPDDQLTASSEAADETSSKHGRLNKVAETGNAWCPSAADPQKWLQIDCGVTQEISHVATQGRQNRPDMVYTFALAYSMGGNEWLNYTENGVRKVKNCFVIILKNSLVIHEGTQIKSELHRKRYEEGEKLLCNHLQKLISNS